MPRSPRRREAVSPRKRPVQERSRRTVEAILEAAAQVLERRGYAGTTTDRIAERAGVSVGSLYQYFPNKDSILLALAACHALEGAAALAPLFRAFRGDEPPPVEEGLRELVRICTGLHDRAGLHRILFAETPLPLEARRALEKGGRAATRELARYLERAPGARVREPRLAAHVVLETVTALVHRLVIRPPEGADAGRCEEELVRLVLGYVRAAPGAPLPTG